MPSRYSIRDQFVRGFLLAGRRRAKRARCGSDPCRWSRAVRCSPCRVAAPTTRRPMEVGRPRSTWSRTRPPRPPTPSSSQLSSRRLPERTSRSTTSFGASGTQAKNVINGQPADVVNFSLEPDMAKLVKAGLVSSSWDTVGPSQGIVTDSVVVFVVTQGQPGPHPELVRPDPVGGEGCHPQPVQLG